MGAAAPTRHHHRGSAPTPLVDQRPYIAALITLDPEAFGEWKHHHLVPATVTVAELRDTAALLAAVQTAVDDANAAVSHAEAIKRFRIVATEFTVSDELTPTRKVRRSRVIAKYATEIAAIYGGA